MDEDKGLCETSDLSRGIFSIFTSDTDNSGNVGGSTGDDNVQMVISLPKPTESMMDVEPIASPEMDDGRHNALKPEFENDKPAVSFSDNSPVNVPLTSELDQPETIVLERKIQGQELDDDVMYIARKPEQHAESETEGSDVMVIDENSGAAFENASASHNPQTSEAGVEQSECDAGEKESSHEKPQECAVEVHTDAEDRIDDDHAIFEVVSADNQPETDADIQLTSKDAASSAPQTGEDHTGRQCVWCKTLCVDKRGLRQHWIDFHEPGMMMKFRVDDEWNPSEGQKLIQGWKCVECGYAFRNQAMIKKHMGKNPGHHCEPAPINALGKNMLALLTKHVHNQMAWSEKKKEKKQANAAKSSGNNTNQSAKQKQDQYAKRKQGKSAKLKPSLHVGKLEAKSVKYVAKFIAENGGRLPIMAMTDGLEKMSPTLKKPVDIAGGLRCFLKRHHDTFTMNNNSVSLKAPAHQAMRGGQWDQYAMGNAYPGSSGLMTNNPYAIQLHSQYGYNQTASTFNQAGLMAPYNANPYAYSAQPLGQNPAWSAASMALGMMSAAPTAEEQPIEPLAIEEGRKEQTKKYLKAMVKEMIKQDGEDEEEGSKEATKGDDDGLDDFIDLEDGSTDAAAAPADGKNAGIKLKLPWKCVQCDEKFSDRGAWSAHVEKDHDPVNKKQRGRKKQKDGDRPGRVLCPCCTEKYLPNEKALGDHVMTKARYSTDHRKVAIERFKILPGVSKEVLAIQADGGTPPAKLMNLPNEFTCCKCYKSADGYSRLNLHQCNPSAIPKARAAQLKKNLEAKIKRQYELYDKLPPYIPPANPRTSTCGKGGEDDMLADSVLNFDQLYEGEDVITRETRKLELKQQQSDADYVAECTQVNMIKQENKAIEDRIVGIKAECVGVQVDEVINEKLLKKQGEVELLQKMRDSLEEDFTKLRDEAFEKRQELAKHYQDTLESMERKISRLERENLRQDAWSRLEDRPEERTDYGYGDRYVDRYDEPMDEPHRSSRRDVLPGYPSSDLSGSLPTPGVASSLNAAISPPRDPRLPVRNSMGAGNIDPHALSQMVNSMVHQAMNSMGGLPK